MLFIDDRAGSNELIQYLSGDDTHVCRLDSGDVCCPGNGPDGDILVGVEVKKVPDLLSSESTGRLAATQLPRLFSDYNEIWLLVIGSYRAGASGELQVLRNNRWASHNVGARPVPYSYLEGFLIEMQTMGVHFQMVESNRAAAWFIRILEHWWSKPWDAHKAMKKFDKSGRPVMVANQNDPDWRLKSQVAEMAATFPGIGWDRAWKLADRYQLPEDLLIATQAELADVDGIGKVLARQLWEAIHGR